MLVLDCWWSLVGKMSMGFNLSEVAWVGIRE